MESKVCQNCKRRFVIEQEDFNFYKKISVPPPTWCPECRLIRRLQWRNEHSLFRRKNEANGEMIISAYHPNAEIKTYDRETWWGDSWDPRDYGRDYDFSRPFFEQFKELMEDVTHIALFDSKSVNSRFCNIVVEMRNSYLVTAGWTSEDSMYCNRISHCKFIQDCYICYRTEFGYENVYCHESNNLFFSRESEACLDSYFLYDCRNCSDCILCTNLRNKKYCIENVQYSKEEYLKMKKEYALNTRSGIKRAQEKFKMLWGNAYHRHLKLINTTNVVGDHVNNARNSYAIFDMEGEVENVKYANWGVTGLRDAYDVGPGCGGNAQLLYEGVSVGVENNYMTLFGVIVWYSQNILYSYMMNNCQNCFGCAEMNSAQYCILNKQYTKEEYEKLVPEIIEQMKNKPYLDKKGRVYTYGEYFPPEISPFSYNESIAQDYFPIERKTAEANGWQWRDYTGGTYKTSIKGKDLPETIAEIDDSILNEVIECEATGKPFKIIEQELLFYRRFNLPLPSLHPDERHRRRLMQRNPMILRKRMCYFGDKEVDTTYLPIEEGGPEKVLCTEHYNKEIY